jgi:hypothetical protein
LALFFPCKEILDSKVSITWIPFEHLLRTYHVAPLWWSRLSHVRHHAWQFLTLLDWFKEKPYYGDIMPHLR